MYYGMHGGETSPSSNQEVVQITACPDCLKYVYVMPIATHATFMELLSNTCNVLWSL